MLANCWRTWPGRACWKAAPKRAGKGALKQADRPASPGLENEGRSRPRRPHQARTAGCALPDFFTHVMQAHPPATDATPGRLLHGCIAGGLRRDRRRPGHARLERTVTQERCRPMRHDEVLEEMGRMVGDPGIEPGMGLPGGVTVRCRTLQLVARRWAGNSGRGGGRQGSKMRETGDCGGRARLSPGRCGSGPGRRICGKMRLRARGRARSAACAGGGGGVSGLSSRAISGDQR